MRAQIVKKLLRVVLIWTISVFFAGPSLWAIQKDTAAQSSGQSRQDAGGALKPRQLGKPEEVSGFIESYEPSERTLVLVSSDGVSYVFLLNKDTEIVLNVS